MRRNRAFQRIAQEHPRMSFAAIFLKFAIARII